MDGEKLIFEAISNGDLHNLKMCMEQLGKDEARRLTSVANVQNWTPLVLACLYGHLEMVEYLIKDVYIRIYVYIYGIYVFDLIDECGADVDLAAGSHSPLWQASADGHLNVVKSLVSRGANVNSALEQSALHVACLNGYFEMVKYLIANGADDQADDGEGTTCLSMACQGDHYQIACYLMQMDVDGRSTLKSLYYMSGMFSWMLFNGKSVDIEVIMAVFALAVNDIEAKVKCGAKIDMFEDEPVLQLISCMTRMRPQMSEEQNKSFGEVVRRYVGLDRGQPDSSTPLQSICSLDGWEGLGRCSYPVVDVVRLLLDAGADPLAVDHGLNTPLHMVAWALPIKDDVIQLLLDRGAHFDARNAKGQCFLDIVDPEDRDQLNPFDYTTLQCLAAQSLKKNNIQYQLPSSLANFVKLH